MLRQNLTNSRHISSRQIGSRQIGSRQIGSAGTTADQPIGRHRTGRAARLLASGAILTALALSSAPGTALADPGSPSAAPAARTASSGPVGTAIALVTTASRNRDEVRTGRITVRERRDARAAIRQSVADLALRQEGDAYASGGEGPHAFDCSGLTLFAWKSVGVNLVHYSAGQYQQVKRISAEAAVPGDLVFYLNRGARHVGVYVGDGKLVHASDYGVGVIVTPVIGTPWTNAHFTGFGRVDIPDETVDVMVQELRKRR